MGGLALVTLLLLPLSGSRLLRASEAGAPGAMAVPTPQTPGEDRLAEPVMPESPTQVDMGRYLYYHHCMPCHGDRGQGLTDEFREIWVEDHQNCWGRGCHAGRSELDAFYIPRSIPAVIGTPQALAPFRTPDDLFAFLRATQPPQRPGALADSEYWALTSFLLHENGRPLPETENRAEEMSNAGLVVATLAPLVFLLGVAWLAGRQARPAS